MKKMLIECPSCGRDIDFQKALREWFDFTGETKLSSDMCLSIWCATCKDMTVMLEIFPASLEEKIDSDAHNFSKKTEDF